MKLHIIWTFSKKGVFETDWIKYLFSDFNIDELEDQNQEFNNFFENSLIIIQDMRNPEFENYIQEFKKRNLNFLILHISDEALNHNVSFYPHFKDKLVRMIYCEKYTNEYGIMTIPVGYKPNLRKIDCEKKYLVNFVGQIKSDRYQMLESYRFVDPKYVSLTNQWDDPNGLGTDDYSKILSESHFTLCPAGWVSVDSFRINEAMECGSIPVSIKYNGINYFEKLYGTNPFVIGENWSNTIELIQNIDVKEKKKEVEIWWSEFKQNLKLKLKDMLTK